MHAQMSKAKLRAAAWLFKLDPPGADVADQIKLVLSYAACRGFDLTWIMPLVISNLPN
jgi:hypothetical protein